MNLNKNFFVNFRLIYILDINLHAKLLMVFFRKRTERWQGAASSSLQEAGQSILLQLEEENGIDSSPKRAESPLEFIDYRVPHKMGNQGKNDCKGSGAV